MHFSPAKVAGTCPRWFSAMTRKTGRYKHYKGKFYAVEGVARHSDTEELLVVYRPLYGDGDLWVRPLSMFTEQVVVDGQSVPRFDYVSDN